MRKIFENIDDKSRLEIIKINKWLQKKVNVNILHYRIFSKKYIVFSSKFKGKEYDSLNNNILYEGEYLNGKKNGKGKEFNKKGTIIFEGEYLNGKRNGKEKNMIIKVE